MANSSRNSGKYSLAETLRSLPSIQVLLEWDNETDLWRAYVPQLGHISASAFTDRDVLWNIKERILDYLAVHEDIRVADIWHGLAEALKNITGGAGQQLLMHEGYEIAVVTPLDHPAVLQEFEDRLDLEEARGLLVDPAEGAPVPWNEVKVQLDQSS